MKNEVLEIDIYDRASINRAVNRLEKIKQRLENMDVYLQRLADIGVTVAQEAFIGAMTNPDFTEGVEVEAIPTDDGISIVASGNEVAFIEFGTGVFYNGSESYPGTRPSGIVGIGEYGYGQGKNEKWWTGDHMTHGHYRSAGMYMAQRKMAEQAVEIIKEIFND